MQSIDDIKGHPSPFLFWKLFLLDDDDGAATAGQHRINDQAAATKRLRAASDAATTAYAANHHRGSSRRSVGRPSRKPTRWILEERTVLRLVIYILYIYNIYYLNERQPTQSREEGNLDFIQSPVLNRTATRCTRQFGSILLLLQTTTVSDFDL